MEVRDNRPPKMFLARSFKIYWIWGAALLLMGASIIAAEEMRWLFAGVLALGAVVAVIIRVSHKAEL